MYAFTQPLHNGHFKWSKSGLISNFSFFKIGCLIKVKEPSLSFYFPKT